MVSVVVCSGGNIPRERERLKEIESVSLEDRGYDLM